MKGFLRSARLWGLLVMPVLVITWLFWTDPDKGNSTAAMLQNALTAGLAVTMTYLTRKFCFPYIKLHELVEGAKAGNIAQAILALGVFIFMSVLVVVFASRAHAQDVRTYVPAGAYVYAPMLKAEQIRFWRDHPSPEILGSLTEKESCLHLKHPRCWNPGAQLRTTREEGAGFGQITRAYHKDGSLRFDALAAARQLDPSLSEWSWVNVYQRPDLQFRGIVLMNRDCYRRISRLVTDEEARLQMCDAAYNGGYAGMQQERRACGQRAGCDPQRWFQHVELACLKSKVKWKGYGDSACDINRKHVQEVMVTRRPKYISLLETT